MAHESGSLAGTYFDSALGPGYVPRSSSSRRANLERPASGTPPWPQPSGSMGPHHDHRPLSSVPGPSWHFLALPGPAASGWASTWATRPFARTHQELCSGRGAHQASALALPVLDGLSVLIVGGFGTERLAALLLQVAVLVPWPARAPRCNPKSRVLFNLFTSFPSWGRPAADGPCSYRVSQPSPSSWSPG